MMLVEKTQEKNTQISHENKQNYTQIWRDIIYINLKLPEKMNLTLS